MSDPQPNLRRLVTSTAIYAAAGLAQQAAGFLLIPLYTRRIAPNDYGVLEIFNSFSAVGFACLTIGLSSAINKCYHRDCQSADDRATLLATAILIDLPLLLLAGIVALVCAQPISAWLTGTTTASSLVPLVTAAGICTSIGTLLLAWFRAQERAQAFCALTLTQFVTALGLNVVFVALLGAGVHGVFWGALLSNLLLIALATVGARGGISWRFNPRLVRLLLSFGLYLIPAMLAGWVMDLSDRYVLRLFSGLDAVAVYGVGYKFGMIVQVAIVWPFQLAWPAFSFSISNHPGHQRTYARTLTYLVTVMVVSVLFLSLLTPLALPLVVGPAYQSAAAVVPLVALAYAFNGVYFCLSPGVHIAGYTRYLSLLAALAAVLNIGLNLLLIPRLGMIGAAWSTLIAFVFLAATTGVLAQRVYPVAYEYVRLAKLVGAAAAVYGAAHVLSPETASLSIVWRLGVPAVALPALLLASGFLATDERLQLTGLVRRYIPALGQ